MIPALEVESEDQQISEELSDDEHDEGVYDVDVPAWQSYDVTKVDEEFQELSKELKA